MGLLYVFPTEKEFSDHIKLKKKQIEIKSLGLPYLFWIYALLILTVYSFLVMSVKNPVSKLMSIGSQLDKILMGLFICLIILVPLVFISAFFYEKVIKSDGKTLSIINKVFFITFRKKTFDLKNSKLEVKHFVDSQNMARIKDDRTLRAFYNQGYFELSLFSKNGKRTLIDRHSQASGLKKLKKLIENPNDLS